MTIDGSPVITHEDLTTLEHPSLVVVMLGRLEPVCQGETVLERNVSLEEYTDREAIYKNYLR